MGMSIDRAPSSVNALVFPLSVIGIPQFGSRAKIQVIASHASFERVHFSFEPLRLSAMRTRQVASERQNEKSFMETSTVCFRPREARGGQGGYSLPRFESLCAHQ